MKRGYEFVIYAVVILFFIARYINVDFGQKIRTPQAPDLPNVMAPDDSPLPDQLPQTFTVELDSKVANGVGTGFSVDSEGTYITARHVVDGCSQVFFVTGGRRLERVESLEIERRKDFAVIKSYRSRKVHLSLSENPPVRGDDGYMMGYPQGKPADVRASVIGTSTMRSEGRYRMREPVIAWVERDRRPKFPGALGGISGGPVFNASGTVVGTVVAGSERRGRILTTHPRVFKEKGLVAASKKGKQEDFPVGITSGNFDQIGRAMRASGTIAQVYCKAV